jgi:predicted NBD/HSP70 family sugar kinase
VKRIEGNFSGCGGEKEHMKPAKTSDVRKVNRDIVLGAMFRSGKLTKGDIAQKTGLSIPTVTTVLNELLEIGLVENCGVMKSDGGRRPQLVELAPHARYAVGIGISRHHINMVLLNLEGHEVAKSRERKEFADNEEYWTHLHSQVCSLLRDASVMPEKILGMGISITGMFTKNTSQIMLPPAMWKETIDPERIRQQFLWPTDFYNDSEMQAVTEIWQNPDLDDATSLSLNQGIGGAFIRGRAIQREMGFDRIGHMVIKTGGRQCTCGKRGCFEAYCSGDAIEKATSYSVEDFFDKLEAGNRRCVDFWKTYVMYLLVGISNIRLLTGTKILIGGQLGEYISQHRQELEKELPKWSALEDDEENALRFQHYSPFDCAAGAALTKISEFLPDTIR